MVWSFTEALFHPLNFSNLEGREYHQQLPLGTSAGFGHASSFHLEPLVVSFPAFSRAGNGK